MLIFHLFSPDCFRLHVAHCWLYPRTYGTSGGEQLGMGGGLATTKVNTNDHVPLDLTTTTKQKPYTYLRLFASVDARQLCS